MKGLRHVTVKACVEKLLTIGRGRLGREGDHRCFPALVPWEAPDPLDDRALLYPLQLFIQAVQFAVRLDLRRSLRRVY